MYLIPLIRSSRAVVACTFFPQHPIIAVSCSEVISYVVPFINSSPIYGFDNMILFLFYFYFYNESSLILINELKNKYILNYQIEIICILFYLLIYNYNL